MIHDKPILTLDDDMMTSSFVDSYAPPAVPDMAGPEKAAILMITMGVRQTTGLFLSPINTATGLGIVSISFALAIGQFVWGATQPIFGAIADKYGSVKVIVAGTLMLALGTALTPFMSSQWGLIVTLGILSAGGAGAGSFSILIGASARMRTSSACCSMNWRESTPCRCSCRCRGMRERCASRRRFRRRRRTARPWRRSPAAPAPAGGRSSACSSPKPICGWATGGDACGCFTPSGASPKVNP